MGGRGLGTREVVPPPPEYSNMERLGGLAVIAPALHEVSPKHSRQFEAARACFCNETVQTGAWEGGAFGESTHESSDREKKSHWTDGGFAEVKLREVEM